MNSTLKDYLITIGKFPLLTPAEELELGERIANGDREARDRLINCNLRLVVFIAKNYKSTHLDLEDLIMEGNQGLIMAADKYDYKLGYRFSTCALPWIKQAILKAITDKGKPIRLPAHVYAQLNKMKKTIEDLEGRGIHNPSNQTIAREMGIDEERVASLQEWRKDTISLDTPLDDEDKNTIEDLVPDQYSKSPIEETEEHLLHEKIISILNSYPTRTQAIVKMRYGLGDATDPEEYRTEHTLEEIGAYLGITRERVRQIEKATLQDIKNNWTE